MGRPPVDEGALKATVTVPSPAVREVMAGLPGGPVGVSGLEAADGGLIPRPLVAVTVKV
jgi:hypothetical protein